MAYGLSPRLFIENGPALEAARARKIRSTDGFRAWRKLHPNRRFELVDKALKAAANDDGIDGYPIAL